VRDETGPDETGPDDTGPDESVYDDAVPGDDAPDHAAPDDGPTVPNQNQLDPDLRRQSRRRKRRSATGPTRR
jgi:hypothetical protein